MNDPVHTVDANKSLLLVVPQATNTVLSSYLTSAVPLPQEAVTLEIGFKSP